MKKWITIALILATANAFSLSIDEIVSKANQAAYYAGEDGQADVKMIITDANGGERSRAFRILRKNTGDETQKFYQRR